MTAYTHISGADDEKVESAERLVNHDSADVSSQYNSSFCWQNISVWGRQKEAQGLWRRTTNRDFQIVQKASGHVPCGSLLAIMGPSGSGKTTLLAAISRRLRERVYGDIYVNGQAVNVDQMLRLSSFVPQDDLTVRGLTVYEHFKIMAALKMDRNTSDFQRDRKVLSLMQEFGVAKLSSSYLFTLSGGEARRISIAVQLLTDPLILFCDEPTTGLDSAYAAAVIRMLKKFSSDKKIVICSIHQPAALIYELFDQVLLLATGGRVAYFGPVMQASNYFGKAGLICPPNYNIAEFLINNVSQSDLDADERINKLCQQYSSSPIKNDLEERIKLACFPDEVKKYKNKMNLIAKYFDTRKPALPTQVLALVHRSCLNLRHEYAGIASLVFNLLFIAAFISALFGEVTLCGENSIQNIRGALCTMTTFTFYESAYYQFNTLISERYFAMREINDGLYRIEAYCIAKLLGKLVFAVCEAVLLVLIFMSISKAYSHLSWWNMLLPFMLTIMAATAYGCMFSSAFNDLNVLFCVATGYEMITYLLTGITINLNSLPFGFSYLRYVALLYYPIEYILVLEWKTASNSNIRCPNDANGPQTALQLLAYNGYDIKYYQKNILIMTAITILLYVVTYLFLRRKSKEPVAY